MINTSHRVDLSARAFTISSRFIGGGVCHGKDGLLKPQSKAEGWSSSFSLSGRTLAEAS
jgi:hypothetical protein